MASEILYDPLQRRWYKELDGEPGRPVIIADSPEDIETFLNKVDAGEFWLEGNEAA